MSSTRRSADRELALVACALLVVFSGCDSALDPGGARGKGGERGSPNQGPDAGTAPAPGATLDAGSPSTADGGGPSDSGNPRDASVPPATDGGILLDRALRVAPDSDLLYQTTMNRDFMKPVWNGSNWVVFWERLEQSCVDPPGAGNLACTVTARALIATVLTGAGTVDSVHSVYSLDPYQNAYRDLDVISTPTGYLATWVEPTGPQLDAQTTIHVLAADGAFGPVHHESFAVGGGWWPKVAGANGVYALFWQAHTPHQQDWFAPLSGDARRGGAVQVSMFTPRMGHHLNTEMEFDGTNFALVYETDAEQIVRCGCNWSTNGNPVEVFLMVLSPSGARLATTRLSEGIEEGMEMMTGNSVAARPGGGFAATWVSTVGGAAQDVVFAQVTSSGARVGANVYLTSTGQSAIEITPRVSSVTGGYAVSYGVNDGSLDWGYGARLLRLDGAGARLAALELVAPVPGCAPLEPFPAYTGVRCVNGSRAGRRLTQAARGSTAITAWPSAVWTTLPGDSAGEWIVDHIGSVALTHW